MQTLSKLPVRHSGDHSPRYLIDMNVSPENTIFSKMGVDYDEFRLSENQIDTVRNYYKNKMKEREQKAMPWWMGVIS